MENIKMIGSWSQDPGLVSNDINNIEKRINLRPIITNVVLSSGWGIGIGSTRSRSDSRGTQSRYIKYKNYIDGTSPPSNHSFLI